MRRGVIPNWQCGTSESRYMQFRRRRAMRGQPHPKTPLLLPGPPCRPFCPGHPIGLVASLTASTSSRPPRSSGCPGSYSPPGSVDAALPTCRCAVDDHGFMREARVLDWDPRGQLVADHKRPRRQRLSAQRAMVRFCQFGTTSSRVNMPLPCRRLNGRHDRHLVRRHAASPTARTLTPTKRSSICTSAAKPSSRRISSAAPPTNSWRNGGSQPFRVQRIRSTADCLTATVIWTSTKSPSMASEVTPSTASTGLPILNRKGARTGRS